MNPICAPDPGRANTLEISDHTNEEFVILIIRERRMKTPAILPELIERSGPDDGETRENGARLFEIPVKIKFN